MAIINMTPHQIDLVLDSGEVWLEINPSGDLIRLSMTTEEDGLVDGIPVSRTTYGEATGLPEFEEGVFYVVSGLVKSALPHREDLLVPSEMVRDDKGRILGCKSLGR